MRAFDTQIIVLIALALIASHHADDNGNKTSVDVNKHNKKIETRRNLRTNKKERSTSSSSGEWEGSSESGTQESLELSDSRDSSTDLYKKGKRNTPLSSPERRGWRKWHRQCTKCPADMAKRWRDQSIKWICGAYQRARRTFKSECMMFYRNCQDGTMFIEIHKGRCSNDTYNDPRPHGDHFFYDYKVKQSGDSSTEVDATASSTEEGSYQVMSY